MAVNLSLSVTVLILNVFLKINVSCSGTLVMDSENVSIKLPGLGEVLGLIEKTYWSERSYYSFYGIHYGETTSGDNRYRAPVPRKPWQTTFNATLRPKRCPQAQTMNEIKINPHEDYEDCLTLNVFTPNLPESGDKKIAVMVYIHGGGFYEGSARNFPPHYFLEKDVVLVVIQYRLGPFGFLSLQTDTIPGNVAFLDQVLALEWVQKNIQHFNGDPKRVTVFGQSAGAASISLLLQSPFVRPELFQQAILQSGSAFGTWVVDDDPISYGLELASAVMKGETVDDVTTAENILKAASVADILESATDLRTNSAGRGTFGGMNAVVQYTGVRNFLPQHPIALAATQRSVPMIAGVTANEGSFVSGYIYDALAKNDLQDNDTFLRNNLTSTALSAVLIDDVTGAIEQIFRHRYFDKTFAKKETVMFKDISAGLIDMMGVLTLKAPTWRAASINARAATTHVYTFQWGGRDTRFGYGEDTSHFPFTGGVAHSDDLLYLFPWPYLNEDGPMGGAGPQNEMDIRMSKTMVNLWTSFAINGKPQSEDVEWPPVTQGQRGPYLIIKPNPELGGDFESEQYTIALQDAIKSPINT